MDITGCEWLEESGYYDGECWVGILKGCANPETAGEFLDYLLNG